MNNGAMAKGSLPGMAQLINQLAPKVALEKEQILAMPVGKELNHLIMKEIFKASMKNYGEDEIWYHYDSNGEPDYEWSCYNSPSTDISAAWEVVDKLKIAVIPQSDGAPDDLKYLARIEKDFKQDEIQVFASTAPEAICKAALLAVMDL